MLFLSYRKVLQRGCVLFCWIWNLLSLSPTPPHTHTSRASTPLRVSARRAFSFRSRPLAPFRCRALCRGLLSNLPFKPPPPNSRRGRPCQVIVVFRAPPRNQPSQAVIFLCQYLQISCERLSRGALQPGVGLLPVTG